MVSGTIGNSDIINTGWDKTEKILTISIARTVEIYSRPLTVILTFVSSIATILQDVVVVAILASVIAILQIIRCDSYKVDFTPEDWDRVGERSWKFTHELAHGFKSVPCSVQRKTNDGCFEEVILLIRYSDDNNKIILCMNGDEGLEGRLMIGGPRGF